MNSGILRALARRGGHFYKNSIDIIKYKEIYELLEEIIDKCEDVAHVIESIAVKHA